MSKETRPDYTYKWASTGDVATPNNSKISLGWIVEKPPMQWWNYIENRQDQAISYLYQQGVAEWDSSIEYQNGSSFVSRNGNIYVSIQTGTNKDPASETAYWKLYGKKFVSAPASAGDTGTSGDWAVDSDYIYVCTATNTWKRATLATW